MARFQIEPVGVIGPTGIDLSRPFPVWGGIQEAATQTYKRGALLVASSGNLQEAGANPTTIIGVALQAGLNLGSAGQGTGTSYGAPQFVPAMPGVVFEASWDKASSLGNGVVTQASMWATWGVTKDSAGIWYVDEDKGGGNQVCLLIGAKQDTVIGTTKQARVYIVFTAKLGLTVW